MAKLIAAVVVQRSLDIRDVVKFRRAMKTQALAEVDQVERLLGHDRVSLFG
jgi:hypothetical protein